MTEPVDNDEDLFADLYEAEDEPIPAVAPKPATPVPETTTLQTEQTASVKAPQELAVTSRTEEPQSHDANMQGSEQYDDSVWQAHEPDHRPQHQQPEQEHSGIMVKEDGKMFIGGLNWETTDEGLRDYFTQFGEVQECTVMRDAATGRSRGFGFLTFRDPKTVNIVMVKEHFLDGKLIDPKRAIPRDEQEKTSKIFVGGVSQDATEEDFEQYFAQFGRVLDATLMMDKDTGRPRGFGFVTFDNEAAVDACLRADLRILGKAVEVKKAQPRGDIRAEEERSGRKTGGRGGYQDYSNSGGGGGNQGANSQGNNNNNNNAMANGMSPSMMVQYWQKMQQMMAMWQAQQAMMGGMNPAMMQQMKLAQMQQMQQQMGMSAKDGQAMQNMNPQMMQQMMMQQQGQNGGGGGQSDGSSSSNNFNNITGNQQQQQTTTTNNQMPGIPTGPSSGGPRRNGGGGSSNSNSGGSGGIGGTYNRQDQQMQNFSASSNAESWEGMYDDVPQPNMLSSGPTSSRGGGGGMSHHFNNRGGGGGGGGGGYAGGAHKQSPPAGPSNAPAGAPTGPRNAHVPGSNYRGGGRGGRGRGFHPYRR